MEYREKLTRQDYIDATKATVVTLLYVAFAVLVGYLTRPNQ